MKMLMYGNRKVDPIYWDASTEEKEQAAYKCLFILLRDDWQCYRDLESDGTELEGREIELKELEKLQAIFDTLPELLKAEAKQKLEQLPRLKWHIVDLKYEKQLWDRIKAGDEKAIPKFLKMRKSGEYEEWEMVDAYDPLAWLQKREQNDQGRDGSEDS